MKPRQPAFMHGAKFRGIHFPKIRRRNERNINSNPFLSVMDGRGFLFLRQALQILTRGNE